MPLPPDRVPPNGSAARLKLLAQEKDAMRAQDAVTARRTELPMVRIDTD